MLAIALVNKKKDTRISLKAEPLQVAPVAATITAIAYAGYKRHEGINLWDITLAVYTANMYAPGMTVTVSNTPGFNGTWEIEKVDATNGIVTVKSGIGRNQGITVAAGSQVLAGGVVDDSVTILGTPVKNAKDEVIAYSYARTGYFIFKPTEKNPNPVVQVNSTGTVAVTVDINYSLDRVNWFAFPTAISGVSVAGGGAGSFILSDFLMTEIYVRVKVTSSGANASYFVLVNE